jgi:hypothetical protein
MTLFRTRRRDECARLQEGVRRRVRASLDALGLWCFRCLPRGSCEHERSGYCFANGFRIDEITVLRVLWGSVGALCLGMQCKREFASRALEQMCRKGMIEAAESVQAGSFSRSHFAIYARAHHWLQDSC